VNYKLQTAWFKRRSRLVIEQDDDESAYEFEGRVREMLQHRKLLSAINEYNNKLRSLYKYGTEEESAFGEKARELLWEHLNDYEVELW
jgi:hypothetical protein